MRVRCARKFFDIDPRAVEARIAAHRGNFGQVLDLGGQAVEHAEGVDNLNRRAEAWLALAEVQRAAGRYGEADASVAEALTLYESRGYAVIENYGYFRDIPECRSYARNLWPSAPWLRGRPDAGMTFGSPGRHSLASVTCI